MAKKPITLDTDDILFEQAKVLMLEKNIKTLPALIRKLVWDEYKSLQNK